MSLSLDEVEHIANLARLQLSQQEKARFREQLSAILDYVARLQELDTRGVPPAAGGILATDTPATSALREDQSRPSLLPQDLLRNAPQVEDDQFRVPPVFE
jgi:aspartyl-tRNA(Asn)/glutamyl-tRNA(Gln) amidotransferase subunit C